MMSLYVMVRLIYYSMVVLKLEHSYVRLINSKVCRRIEFFSLAYWSAGYSVQRGASASHSGYFCYTDGTVGRLNWLYQSFATIPGRLLYISFWIAWYGSGPGITANVTIF